MTINEDIFKPVVRDFLGNLGLHVRDIPCRDSKTPDFEIKDEHDTYIVELKIKSDDPVEIERDNNVLRSGKILEKAIPIGPRNRLSAVVTDGVDQFKEYDPDNNTYHVLWLHSEGRDPELLNTRFRSTLFGMQNLVSLEVPHLMTCYFFEESAFYTYRDCLDAAILTYEDQLQLCVNSLSYRKAPFKNSGMYSVLSRGLCDPDNLKQEDGVLIADCTEDRKDQGRIVDYLREKYHLNHLQIIAMTQHSATVAIPKNE
jgi:hypothetical protein